MFVVSRAISPDTFLHTKSAQETKQLSLEEIDLLFGDRALGMIPNDLADAEKQIEMERIEDAKKKLAGTNVAAVH